MKSNDHQVQGICPLESTSSLTKPSSSTTTPSKTTTSATAAPGYSPKTTPTVPTSSIIIPPSEPSSYPDPNQKPPSAILSIPADSTLLEGNAAITSLSIRLSDKVALDLTAGNSMEQGHEVPEEEAFNDQVPENQAAKDLVTEEEPQKVVLEQRCVDKPNEVSDETATIEEPTEHETASVLQGTLEKRTFVDVKPEIDAIIKPEPDSRIKEENKPKDLLR